ncbi:MAG: hypothetical protein DRR42_06210 [Gammaproteobacteria bacterium]|nr:MAG: hypothetical protein DRR42_06210 [Gammaproteobacteria bacterium]
MCRWIAIYCWKQQTELLYIRQALQKRWGARKTRGLYIHSNSQCQDLGDSRELVANWVGVRANGGVN